MTDIHLENSVATQNHAKVKQPSVARTKKVKMGRTQLQAEPTTKAVSRAPRSNQPATVFVDFGGITMHVSKPSRAQVRARIAEGEHALIQLSKVLSKPGVKIALSKEHPTYVADKRDPTLVVQKIGEVSRRGRFAVNGKFVEVK